MVSKMLSRVGYTVVLMALLLGLGGAAWASARNIDPGDKWAWGTNTGWINFSPSCDGCDGVRVYSDHLEGYAWGENVGWIRMGGYEGGGPHTYGNSTAADYGVNNDGSGNLSGYAWGTNAGWINFDPAHGGVTIDMASGEFDGYAWAENTGWISFKGVAADLTEYGVAALQFRLYLPIVSK